MGARASGRTIRRATELGEGVHTRPTATNVCSAMNGSGRENASAASPVAARSATNSARAIGLREPVVARFLFAFHAWNVAAS